jgi:hypothetical protein
LQTADAGLNLRGMVKDIQPVVTKNGLNFLFLQNDAVPLLFSVQMPVPKNKKAN